MQIFVKHDRTHTFEVNLDMTIKELKNKIQDKFGLPPEDYFLNFAGKGLYSGKLGDYLITKESTIIINLRMR